MRGEVGSALPLFDRALAVTEGDPMLVDLRLLVQVNYAVALGDLDRYDRAIETAREVRGLAERTGSLVRLTQAQGALGELLFDVGRWDEALAEVAAIPDDVKDPGVACCDHGVAGVIGFHRGRPEQARRHVELAAPCARRIGNRVIGSLALARSLEHEYGGAPREALAVLTGCLTGQAEELEEMEDLLPDAVRLAVALGDRGTAVGLVGRAEHLAERTWVPHRSAAALYCRGIAERDPDRLLLATKEYGEAGRPLPRARALEAAAIAGSGGEALIAAREIYASLDARWDLARLPG